MPPNNQPRRTSPAVEDDLERILELINTRLRPGCGYRRAARHLPGERHEQGAAADPQGSGAARKTMQAEIKAKKPGAYSIGRRD